jgi:hypothetical protein
VVIIADIRDSKQLYKDLLKLDHVKGLAHAFMNYWDNVRLKIRSIYTKI